MARRQKHLKLMRPTMVGSRLRDRVGFNPSSYRPSWMSRFNPGTALARNIVHPVSMDGLKTLGGVTVGLVGTGLIPTKKLVEMIPVIGKLPIVPILIANGINMTILASVAKKLTKSSEFANNVLAGGLAITGVQIIWSMARAMPTVTAMQSVAAMTMAGLGQNETEKVKKMIQERIRKELKGADGLPYESSYSVAGRGMNAPPAEPSYSTVGGNDELTEDTM